MRRRVIAAVVVALAALACSAPPDKERHQAEGAISAARAADAALYAPDDLAAAERALSQYDAAVAQHDYRLALRLAVDARDDAFQAARKASDAKAAARSRAEALLGELERLQRAGTTRLRTGSGRLGGPAIDRLRGEVSQASTTLQEARSDVAAQKYMDAVSRLAPATERLREVLELPALPPLRGGR
jgi:hypothetical protein